MPDLDHPYFPLIVALGIGLLIGAERERRKGEGPFRAAAGVRTFAITAVLGAVAMNIGRRDSPQRDHGGDNRIDSDSLFPQSG